MNEPLPPLGPKDTEWPPTGFHSFYTVDENVERHDPFTYKLALPSTFSQVDMSTFRIGRLGGPNRDDFEFRSELYPLLGAILVAGGHVETAMKRLVLLLDQESEARFSLVDRTWTDLHKTLRQHANGSEQRSVVLAAELDWAEKNRIKERRDNVVHAYWWPYAGCGVRRSRFHRRTDGSLILASLTDLKEDCRLLFEYAERLDALLGTDWPMARL